MLSRLTSFSLDLITPVDSEVSAVAIAVSWLQNHDDVPYEPSSVTAVEAISRTTLPPHQQSATMKVHAFLSQHPQVIAQFIRGHCSIPGNETEHDAAHRTAADNRNITSPQQPVTFASIKYLINSTILDPPQLNDPHTHTHTHTTTTHVVLI